MPENQRTGEKVFYGTLGGLAGATGMAHYIANKRIQQAAQEPEAQVTVSKVIQSTPTTDTENVIVSGTPIINGVPEILEKINNYSNTHTINQAAGDAQTKISDYAGGFFENTESGVSHKIDKIIEEGLGAKLALGLGGGALGYMAGENFSDDISGLGKDLGSGLSRVSNAIGHTLQTGVPSMDNSVGAVIRDHNVGKTIGDFAKNNSGLIGAGLTGAAAASLAPKRKY